MQLLVKLEERTAINLFVILSGWKIRKRVVIDTDYPKILRRILRNQPREYTREDKLGNQYRILIPRKEGFSSHGVKLFSVAWAESKRDYFLKIDPEDFNRVLLPEDKIVIRKEIFGYVADWYSQWDYFDWEEDIETLSDYYGGLSLFELEGDVVSLPQQTRDKKYPVDNSIIDSFQKFRPVEDIQVYYETVGLPDAKFDETRGGLFKKDGRTDRAIKKREEKVKKEMEDFLGSVPKSFWRKIMRRPEEELAFDFDSKDGSEMDMFPIFVTNKSYEPSHQEETVRNNMEGDARRFSSKTLLKRKRERSRNDRTNKSKKGLAVPNGLCS